MKYNIKQSSLLMLFALFLVAFCFIACDDQDNEEQEQVGNSLPKLSIKLHGVAPDIVPHGV